MDPNAGHVLFALGRRCEDWPTVWPMRLALSVLLRTCTRCLHILAIPRFFFFRLSSVRPILPAPSPVFSGRQTDYVSSLRPPWKSGTRLNVRFIRFLRPVVISTSRCVVDGLFSGIDIAPLAAITVRKAKNGGDKNDNRKLSGQYSGR